MGSRNCLFKISFALSNPTSSAIQNDSAIIAIVIRLITRENLAYHWAGRVMDLIVGGMGVVSVGLVERDWNKEDKCRQRRGRRKGAHEKRVSNIKK